MFIYTGTAAGEHFDKIKELGLGIMVSSSVTWSPRKDYVQVPCAMDNGAFQFWRRGFPFMADVFRRTIAKAYEVGLSFDFIVCPDLVAGGMDSLDFSMEWARGELRSVPRLALAVQDGMTPKDLTPGYHLRRFSHLFVGGTVEWKWRTAQEWIDYAHEHGKKCHIGQVGTLERLRAADRMGADSVDSTSIVRNQSWEIVEQFLAGATQSELPLAEDSEMEGS